MDRTGDTSAVESAPIFQDPSRAEPEGLHPIASLLIAIWYGMAAAGAMTMGFRFLHEGSPDDYEAVTNLMWAVGISIGVAVAVTLVKRGPWVVGIVSSLILSGGMLSLLHFVPSDVSSSVSIFGYVPTTGQFILGMAALTLLSGLIGTALGKNARTDAEFMDVLTGIRHRHWLWLWLALYAWISIVPTGVYYIWLELISTGYVLIHPSLWFSDAWTEGWTISFGFGGVAALMYGVEMSLKNVSLTQSAGISTGKRVGSFLLGTLILGGGPVSNILFRIAIHSLKHLPDGITENPWWVLR